jgi:hypothetical protein
VNETTQRLDALWTQLLAAGDLIVAAAAGIPGRLAKGADESILKMTAGALGWFAKGADNTVLKTVAGALSWAQIATADLANGSVTIAKLGSDEPYVSAKSTAAQSLTNAAYNTLTYNTEDVDTDAAFNAGTGVFTVPAGKGGEYEYSASISFSTAGGTAWALSAFKNGSTQLTEVQNNMTPGGETTLQIASTERLVAGDTLEMKGWQNSGGNKTLCAHAVHNWIRIRRLA